MINDLAGRVRRIITSPKTEWGAIAQEELIPAQLATGYILPLAGVAALAGFIGSAIFGVEILGTVHRTGFFTGLVAAVVSVAITVGLAYVFAYIIDSLAPSFGSTRNFRQAFKVAAFAPTPVWVAGVFQIIPALGILTLVGAIYSLYLIFVGLPKLMNPAPGKATTYTLAAIAVAIAVNILIAFIASPLMGRGGAVTSSDAGGRAGSGVARVAGGEVASGAPKSLDERVAQMEKAAESGDISAIVGALGGLSSEEANAPLVDMEALRGLAPARIAGLPRQSIEVESLSFPIRAAVMTATYGEGAKRVTFKVTNSPMISGVMAVAGLAGAEYDREGPDGHERLRRKGDTVVLEEWSKSGRTGRYAQTVGKVFMIEAEGDDVEFSALKDTVTKYTANELAKLPRTAG